MQVCRLSQSSRCKTPDALHTAAQCTPLHHPLRCRRRPTNDACTMITSSTFSTTEPHNLIQILRRRSYHEAPFPTTLSEYTGVKDIVFSADYHRRYLVLVRDDLQGICNVGNLTAETLLKAAHPPAAEGVQISHHRNCCSRLGVYEPQLFGAQDVLGHIIINLSLCITS